MLRSRYLRHIYVLLVAGPLLVVPLVADAATPSTAAAASPPDRVAEVRFQPASAGGALGPVEGRLEVRFPGERLSRTLVQWVLALASNLVGKNEYGFYNLRLSGEVRRDERQVDHFDYRFDIPAGEVADEHLALVFDRDLRPGHYQLALTLQDLATGHSFATQGDLEVPDLVGTAPAASAVPLDPGIVPPRGLVAPPPEPARIDLLAPEEPILVGHHRFAAVSRGDGVERVSFLLDGRPVLTRNRPPFTVELDLGREAEVRTLTVEAHDASGAVVARDELVLNTGQQRFGVELVAPRSGDRVGAEVTARARVAVPADQRLRRLEYYLGEEPVVVVEEPPFDAAVRLAGVNGTTAVRAVAHLADGRTAEDTVLVNAPDVVDEVGVHLVELFTAVVDRRGRGIEGLAAADFRVREDGAAQELVRFDRVDGLPVHASLVLDVSGSMGEVLDDVRRAALGFLERALTPRDRASIVTFDHLPRQVVDFTADFNRLANGLAGLRAHGGTALHAGLLFALRQFDGVEGQKVALLFSDGQEKEELESEAVLEYARRSGVTVYTIGFRLPWGEDSGRVLLRRLAEDTGGRSYFVADTGALATAYADIERDMRSRYLLAYQSSNPSGGGFRVVDVELSRPGLEARTVRGYYP